MRYLYDHLKATKDVEKVKSIGAQQLAQNLRAYLMRCTIMTQGLFEVGDAYEKNDVRLTKEMNPLEDDLKVQTAKVEKLTKQLSYMKKQKETLESQLSEMKKQKETVDSKFSKL